MIPSLTTLRQRVTVLMAAGALAIAALGAGTSPAQADSNRALKLLLGATAVAIIAHGASRSHAAPPSRHYREQHVVPRGQHYQNRRAAPPKAHKQPRRARYLPHQCSTRYVYRGQRHAGYVGSCLHSYGVRNVPQACHVSRHGGQVYSAACLSRHGFHRG